MNGSYYKNPVFNGEVPKRETEAPNKYSDGQLPMEQSYIENILRRNVGKKATIYASFADAVDWRDMKFTGIIFAAGRDHVVINEPNTGKWYLILMIYLDFVEFDEKLNYGL